MKRTPDIAPQVARKMRDQCLYFAVHRLERVIGRHYERALRPIELLPSQLAVLAILRAAQPLTVTDLARYAQVDVTTMTRVLQGLRTRRLVGVRPGHDRRTVRARLTPAGTRRLADAYRIWCELQKELFRNLPASSTKKLISLARAFEVLA